MAAERSTILRWIRGGKQNPWGNDPHELDFGLVDRTLDRAERLFGAGRAFEVSVEGWENVAPAPAMLVANHSGGTTIPDVWGLLYAWYRHFGHDRPVHPMAHEFIHSTRMTGPVFSRLGVLRTSPERAEQVLIGARRDVLVLPGGDLDTWRPYTERFKVRFSGRQGYARLALRLGVPIVPIAHAGAHETLVVLTDGAKLARRLGLPKMARASVMPLHLSLPWGLAFGPMPHIPFPAKMRYRIAPAVIPPKLAPGAEPTPEQIADLDARVQAAIQAELDQLAATRTSRVRSRLRALRRRASGSGPV